MKGFEMINVKIHETILLDLFMNRIKYWTTDTNVLKLYEIYLKDLIDCGCFENAELNVNLIVDKLYVNDTAVTDREGLSQQYDIEVDDYDRILASDEDNDLYLVSTY